MKFENVIQTLRKGDGIRRGGWPIGKRLHLASGAGDGRRVLVMSDRVGTMSHALDITEILAEDWFVYEGSSA